MSSSLSAKVAKSYRPQSGKFQLEVSAEFHAGVTAIFGPSGSGKSTWLDCIAGLARPEAGRVVLQGRTLFDSKRGDDVAPGRRDIGYLFQRPSLFPHMTVRANVEYGLAGKPKDTARALQTMEQFHVAHLAEKRPSQISGGEQQRVALARALVRTPQCLMLDEPFSALDHLTKRKIMNDVLKWNEEQPVPILLVTHAIEEVLTMAQRVIVLDQGRIAADGEPRRVLDQQRQELIASL